MRLFARSGTEHEDRSVSVCTSMGETGKPASLGFFAPTAHAEVHRCTLYFVRLPLPACLATCYLLPVW